MDIKQFTGMQPGFEKNEDIFAIFVEIWGALPNIKTKLKNSRSRSLKGGGPGLVHDQGLGGVPNIKT